LKHNYSFCSTGHFPGSASLSRSALVSLCLANIGHKVPLRSETGRAKPQAKRCVPSLKRYCGNRRLVHRFAYGCFVATILSAQNQAPPAIVLQHANVIDGVSSQPVLDVTIVLRDGKIASIGALSPNGLTGAHIIDVGGRWVLPGLIDAHTHVNTIAAAKTALDSGLTTVRVLGSEHYVDIGLRELHRNGMFTIPDVVACGYQIHPDLSEQFILDHPKLMAFRPKLGGAENIGRAIKANLDRGVDCIT
jgi:hypothetical protein